MIHGRHVFGDAQRVAQREDLHGRADPHAPRAGGDEARQRDRRRVHGARRTEVDLAEPHAVESRCFGRVREIERLLERRGLAAPRPPFLEEDAEVHGAPDNALLELHCQRRLEPNGDAQCPGS